MFIPKLLCTVDDRINQWLLQCCREQMVQETTLELVNFSDIIIKLQLHNFNCFLPFNIKKVIKEGSLLKKRDTDSDNQKSNKKAKQDNATMVKNKNMNKDWRFKDSEKLNPVFRHKSKDAPILSMNCCTCLKYHVKGFCFKDCNYRGSHVELEGEDYEKNGK